MEGMEAVEAEQVATRMALFVVIGFIAAGGLILYFVREEQPVTDAVGAEA